MSVEFILIFLLAFILTVLGGSILFSDKALDKIYKLGIWKDESKLFGEKESRRLDRFYRGGRIFIIWLIVLVALVFFLYDSLTSG